MEKKARFQIFLGTFREFFHRETILYVSLLRFHGSTLACVSPVSVGIQRITGVTLSTIYTGVNQRPGTASLVTMLNSLRMLCKR